MYGLHSNKFNLILSIKYDRLLGTHGELPERSNGAPC